MDLKVIHAQLPDRIGKWEIAIANGKIQHVAESIPEAATQTLDAAGNLVIPGFVDAHMHLDKAYLLDRCQRVEGTFAEAMRETLQAKRAFTTNDIQTRARRAIERAIAFGTTTMRSHVEVDPVVGLTGIEALVPLRDEYAWGITLQLAVFAQEGITNQPGIPELLRKAMTLGGDVIGSAPYVDPDPAQNIAAVFDIAQEFNCDVDFHLDFLDDEEPLLLPLIITETLRRGWQGRVCLGHMTKLAGLPPQELAELAQSTQAAGISILALPASDLYMMARRDTHNIRRGVAPLHQLVQAGVTCGVATNNVQNLFTPFGDGDVLKICTLLSQVLHLGTIAQHNTCLKLATTDAANAIGISPYGIVPGSPAELVILDVESVTEAIAAPPLNRTVIKHGKVVAKTNVEQQLFPC